MKRIILFGLLAGMLSASTGCGLYQAVFCGRSCGGRCGCSSGYCGDECGDNCGPTCGRPVRPACTPRRAVVADCDEGCDGDCARPCHKTSCGSCAPCSDPCSDPCGDGCCGRPWHRGPLSCLFALFAPNCWCGPSCGERYWGDFYSDAPACEDPCDNYGNYSGGGCHNCGSSGHARGYHNGGYYSDDGEPMTQDGELTPQADRVVNPAKKPTLAPHKASKPQPESP